MTSHTHNFNSRDLTGEEWLTDTDTEHALMASIQRQLLIRFLKTTVLHHVQDQSLIRFVTDNVGTDVLQGDPEYRAWVQSQGIDAENLHAITQDGKEFLQSLINQWLKDQTSHDVEF